MTSTAPRVNPTELRQSGTSANPGRNSLAGVLFAQPCGFPKSRTPAVRQGPLPGSISLQYNNLNPGTCSPPYGGHVRTDGLPPTLGLAGQVKTVPHLGSGRAPTGFSAPRKDILRHFKRTVNRRRRAVTR